MRAIGAANDAAHATPAGMAGGVAAQLAGGAAPVSASAPVTPATSDLDAPVDIELVNVEVGEVAGVKAAAERFGVKVDVSERTLSVQDVLKTLNDPDDRASERLETMRGTLLDDLKSGRGDARKIIERLDGLSVLIQVVKRNEEKKLLMKKLLKMLMLGILTPSLIAEAKSLGLVQFLKEAIREMVKRGFVSPQQAKAMAGMLASAGIQMPVLDDIVIRQDEKEQGIEDARRATREQLVNGVDATTGQTPGTPGTTGAATTGAADGAAFLLPMLDGGS
jgi:hypothetical protein